MPPRGVGGRYQAREEGCITCGGLSPSGSAGGGGASPEALGRGGGTCVACMDAPQCFHRREGRIATGLLEEKVYYPAGPHREGLGDETCGSAWEERGPAAAIALGAPGWCVQLLDCEPSTYQPAAVLCGSTARGSCIGPSRTCHGSYNHHPRTRYQPTDTAETEHGTSALWRV